MLSRIESQSAVINKIFDISNNVSLDEGLTIISLKECNTVAKKLIPLLLVNYLYDLQKKILSKKL